MAHGRFVSTPALTAAVVLLWLPASAAAQEWLARTPDGQPDIQGVWNRRVTGMATYSLEGGGNEEHILLSGGCAQGIVGCERPPEEIRAQAEKRRNEYVTIITDPPGGTLPYLPWAAAKRQGIAANHTNPRGPGDIDPMARCFPVGVPRATYHEVTGMQIHQVPGRVVLTYEFNHAYRVIPVDGTPHIAESIKLWMGDSRGRWEGNTLVVDVTNHNDRTWFDIVGSFHSDALHVVERFTLVDPDTIHYQGTITDPKVFSRPWTVAFPITRNKQPGFEHLEMACHEGERSFGLMLGR